MAVAAKTGPVSSFERLSPAARLWADTSACLGVRFPGTACRACESACPTSTLKITDGRLELADGCTDCGRCAAACPSHALSVPGFQSSAADDIGDVLEVDCAKVPGAGEGAGELRVPCLGGLSRSRLLALVTARPERTVVLMDRGWCTHCSAGGSRHPAAAQVAQVNRWLSFMGILETRHIRHEYRPLPLSRMPAQIPDPSARRPMDRRGFLRQLAGQVAVAAHGSDPALDRVGEPLPPDGARRIHPAERVAILARLQDLAPHPRHPLPAELFHEVIIDAGRCGHHGVCARACPTAALEIWESGSECGIRFDPAACTGCGECQRVCPEQALRLQPARSAQLPLRPRMLSRHGMRVCGDCHEGFVTGDRHWSDADLPVCPACEKSQGLMAVTFQRLLGHGIDTVDPPENQERNV